VFLRIFIILGASTSQTRAYLNFLGGNSTFRQPRNRPRTLHLPSSCTALRTLSEASRSANPSYLKSFDDYRSAPRRPSPPLRNFSSILKPITMDLRISPKPDSFPAVTTSRKRKFMSDEPLESILPQTFKRQRANAELRKWFSASPEASREEFNGHHNDSTGKVQSKKIRREVSVTPPRPEGSQLGAECFKLMQAAPSENHKELKHLPEEKSRKRNLAEVDPQEQIPPPAQKRRQMQPRFAGSSLLRLESLHRLVGDLRKSGSLKRKSIEDKPEISVTPESSKRQRPRPESPTSSSLKSETCRRAITDLPTEILQLICEFAPAGGRMSLALVNHLLCNILGTQHLSSLCLRSEEHKIAVSCFLTALQRDLPHYTACLQCSKLHRAFYLQPALAPYPYRSLTNCDVLDGGHRACSHILLAPRVLQSIFYAVGGRLLPAVQIPPLQHSCAEKLSSGEILTNQISAKLVATGRLIVKSEHRLQLSYHWSDPAKAFEESLAHLPRTCPHDKFYDSLLALCSCAISHKLVDSDRHRPQHRALSTLVEQSQRRRDQTINLKRLGPAERLRKDCKYAASVAVPEIIRQISTPIPYKTQAEIQKAVVEGSESSEPAILHPPSALQPLITKQASWTQVVKKPKPKLQGLSSTRDPRSRLLAAAETQRPHPATTPTDVVSDAAMEDGGRTTTTAAKVPSLVAPGRQHYEPPTPRAELSEAARTAITPCGRCLGVRRCLFCPTEVFVTATDWEPLPDPHARRDLQEERHKRNRSKTYDYRLDARKTGCVLKIETWKDFGINRDAWAFSKTFLSHRTEPVAPPEMYEEFDPLTPYLYPLGSLKKVWEETEKAERVADWRRRTQRLGRQDVHEEKAGKERRRVDLEMEMKPVLQDVRLGPNLTRYI
jgi:hypothetical protein